MENCFQANLRFINLGDTFQKALSVGASVREAGETPNLLVKTRSPGGFLPCRWQSEIVVEVRLALLD